MGTNGTFTKTICSICFEDLKPVVEDLQAISICGHVFHELCLQQWFEYCPGKKKCSCPVCKQTFPPNNVNRLYFQSVGDTNDSVLTQKAIVRDEDPETLRREVKRLEVKVSGLNSILEKQGKDFNVLNEELCYFKDLAKKESDLKNEALKHRVSLQELIHLKLEELNKSTLECSKLKEMNMALGKELASLKLLSDLNLDEEEVLKLASLGNGANNKETIDVLRRSLVMRNKSYKELMAKCNLLGRGEARFSKKLEKAKEKINKLKTRVHELETSAEVKDNEVLRVLKASKKMFCEGDILNSGNCNSNSRSASEGLTDKPSAPLLKLDEGESLTKNQFCPRKTEGDSVKDMGVNYSKGCANTVVRSKYMNVYSLVDEDISEVSNAVLGIPNPSPKHRTGEDVAFKFSLSSSKAASNCKKDATVHGVCNLAGHLGSVTDTINNKGNVPSAAMDEDVKLFLDDTSQAPPMLNIRKETQSPVPLCQPGDLCFSGGLLGPDGTTRYLGKWCKRDKGSQAMQGSSASSGGLIAVGADGRGGRIKVLRSTNQSSSVLSLLTLFLDHAHGIMVPYLRSHCCKILSLILWKLSPCLFMQDGEASVWAKRCKYGAKSSSSQSKGCLQIEHFFGRVGN